MSEEVIKDLEESSINFHFKDKSGKQIIIPNYFVPYAVLIIIPPPDGDSGDAQETEAKKNIYHSDESRNWCQRIRTNPATSR